MASNKTAVDKIHDRMNRSFKTRVNPNWKAIIEAIGESDQDVANLVEEVRKQFFINSATRPYIDRLGSNMDVTRPRIVGMDDATFRRYIPILAYQPKQVKQIFDQLLDVFFFKEATTAFVESNAYEPFFIKDGWELSYVLDGLNTENIVFNASSFTDISNATTEDVVAVINRQAKHSFAVVFDDRVAKRKRIRLFTNTVGSKGSVEIVGGRANISLKMGEMIDGAGSGNTTQWSISKVGDTVTFVAIGGAAVNLDLVQVGDIAIIDMPSNNGSFIVETVDLATNSFTFRNLFGTAMIFDHGVTPGYYVRFLRPSRSVVWTRNNRAAVWEVSPGEIIVEMPATPPVVRRELKGSAHLNGMVARMVNRVSDISIEIDDASEWPSAGQFTLAPVQEVQTHIVTGLEDVIETTQIDGRFDAVNLHFTYSSKSGNTLSGITPSLPVDGLFTEIPITNISRASDLVSVTTASAHGLRQGMSVAVYGTLTSMDGTWQVVEVLGPSTFTYWSQGIDETAVVGEVRTEKVGLANDGSTVYLTSALINTGIIGPYLWDPQAAFVLSGYTAQLINEVNAGTVVLNLQVTTPNAIPNEQGFLIFDYGLETQEGPVRYLYKASDSTIALDPAYVFQYTHAVGSTVTAIRRKGAQVMSGLGKEYAFYISDPSGARVVLQDLIRQVKSVGVFLRFIVRYPELFYSDFDTYSKTDTPLD